MDRPCSALRAALRDGYSAAAIRGDLTAGAVVAVVALPLSMALSIAIGLPPQHGLYTAIVAGFLVALLGGSRTQVTGPTAAFVAVLVPVVQLHGPAGLMVASALAGLMLICLGVLRFGRYIQLVPYPVVAGFTAGIAVTIATGQLAGFAGMQGVASKAHFHEVLGELWRCLPTVGVWDLGLGVLTLALLICSPRLLPRIPAPLIAIGVGSVLAVVVESTGFADVQTIADRFSFVDASGNERTGVPPGAPVPGWPWLAAGANGAPFELDFVTLKDLLVAAVAICILGAIESLLSAVVADSMTGKRHDPDAELLAQGVGNVAAACFGGFAATGAIARTATNIKSGAVSPIASMFHAVVLLVGAVTITPILSRMPIAAMSALLLLVAWRMADVRHVARVLRTAPDADKAVLVACLSLTVAFDMIVGVVAGLVLACLLFLRRMARLTGARMLLPEDAGPDIDVPPNVLVYSIEGPLFFGAAERAMRVLHSIGERGAIIVLDLRGVQIIDATGLVNLESALARLADAQARTVLTGVRADVGDALRRAGISGDEQRLFIRGALREGLDVARRLAAEV